MQFEWDEWKRRENTRKHNLDFADAPDLFAGPLLVAPDEREDYGEERWIGIGFVRGRVVVVVFTARGDHSRRLISLRKALSHERARFEETLRNRLGHR